MLVVSIGLTLFPAFPGLAIRIYTLPQGLMWLAKSKGGLLLLLGILFVLSVLMAEWANDGYIARMKAISSTIIRATLSITGGVFALAVIGYFAWLVWKLVMIVLRTFSKVVKQRRHREPLE